MKLTLFDLDGTLLSIDSDHAFGEFMIDLGWADGELYRARNDHFYAQYLAGRLDIAAYIEFATAPWRDRSSDELAQAQEQFLAEVVSPAVHEPALALVRRHQEAGDLTAVVTATNEFITRPIVRLFGVEHLLATELERDAKGQVTGAIRGTPAYREGKVERVQQWLRGLGHDWRDFERQLFYSDSTNDLPLLECVSEPIATNPGPELERIASDRGWPILRLFE